MPVFTSLVSRSDAAGVIPDAEVAALVSAVAAQSISLSLFRQVNMGTATTKLPFIATLPDAYWVNGDTGLKQTMDLPRFGRHGVVRRLGPLMLSCISSC